MNFIKVRFLCTVGNSSYLKDLGLSDKDVETEYREGFINIDGIIAFYPNGEGDGTLIEAYESTYTVEETCDKIADLIMGAGVEIQRFP